jgi:hypothetical protein
MPAKDEYTQLCRSEATMPIFSQDWWLDAVCGPENWDVAIVKNNEQIVAALPYYMVRWLLGTKITMPLLTQTMGIWIRYPQNQKYTSRLSLEKKVMTDLIKQLPGFYYFRQNFHYSITNWLPFYWHGFKQSTYYTYIIEELDDLAKVFDNFKSNIRGKIRKAEKIVKISNGGTIDGFYRLSKMTFERQNLRAPYSLELVQRMGTILIGACSKNG